MKIYLVTRRDPTWCEDDAMVVIAKDERRAERRARWSSGDFKTDKNLMIREIDLDTEQVVLISNIGA